MAGFYHGRTVGYDAGMAIDIEWQDERGQTLVRYDGPAINKRVWSAFPNSAACLRFIDPIGDTVFNQAQVRVLVAELDALLTPPRERMPNPALVSIRQFIDHNLGRSHTYLKFIGD
jgi:hypothetical protein